MVVFGDNKSSDDIINNDDEVVASDVLVHSYSTHFFLHSSWTRLRRDHADPRQPEVKLPEEGTRDMLSQVLLIDLLVEVNSCPRNGGVTGDTYNAGATNITSFTLT